MKSGLPKNERGYALLIVLLLIVFIFSISAIFMRGSLSNAKQEVKVDNTHLSVMAAEMGIDYYRTFYENASIAIVRKLTADYLADFETDKASILKDNKKSTETKNTEIKIRKDFYRQKLVENIPLQLLKLDLYHPNNVYFLKPEKFTKIEEMKLSPYEFGIKGKVTGIYKNSMPSELGVEMIFFVPEEWTENKFDEGSFITSRVDFSFSNPNWNECKVDSDFKENCLLNTKKLPNKDFELKVQKNLTMYILDRLDVYNMKVSKATIYTKNEISIDNEMKMEDNSKIVIANKLTVKKKKGKDDDDSELELQNNSELHVKEDIKVFGELELEDQSFLYGGKDLDVQEDIDLQNQSNVIIARDVWVKEDVELQGGSTFIIGRDFKADEVELEGNSKICVGRNIKLNNFSADSGSFLYYKGKIIQAPSSKKIVKLDDREFEEKCGFSMTMKNNWESPEIKVEYN